MTWIRRALRRAALAALPIAMILSPVTVRAAGPTVTGTFDASDHFVDDGSTAACGFPVRVDLDGTGHYELGFDATGAPAWLTIHTFRSGTVSGNGIVLPELDRDNQMLDLTSEAKHDVGIVFKISGTSGGPVEFDRGFIGVAADGTLEMLAGPHPALEGDLTGLCRALGG